MKGVIIKAIFKGKNGSCGYKTGMEYELRMWQHSENGFKNIAIELESHHDEQYCEYSNIISFLENWDCVRVVKHLNKMA